MSEIGDDVPLNAIVIKEWGDSFVSTCINLHIDGYGKTADGAVADMKVNCDYFIKRNFELLPARDAWDNIIDLFRMDEWAKETWDLFYRFLFERKMNEGQVDFARAVQSVTRDMDRLLS
jgi:hypothetical protein